LLLGFTSSVAYAQSWEMPSEAQRCPSKWGAKDEIGSGNLMKPEMALNAAKLIRNGKVFSLGYPLEPLKIVGGTGSTIATIAVR
jgi:hypothetical protein